MIERPGDVSRVERLASSDLHRHPAFVPREHPLVAAAQRDHHILGTAEAERRLATPRARDRHWSVIAK